MIKWKKHGRIFNPIEIIGRPTWMNEYAQAPATLFFDTFIRVYFSCRPPKDQRGQFVSYSAYLDLDKKDLFNIINIANKPILELGDKGCFDEFGIYPISVIRIDDKIYCYYTGHTRCESVPFDTAIGLAISENHDEKFKKIGKGPILSHSLDEPFVISGPKIRKFNGVYYLFYISGKKWIESNSKKEVVYKIRLAHSINGLNWSKLNRNIITEKYGENEVQGSPDVFYKNGMYHMFFCYMLTPDFRFDKSKSYRIGYASSKDLINWERDDSKVGIDISEDGFDNEMIAYPHIFELDGRVYMLYLGNEVGRFGFGLAELEGELM